MDKKSLFLNGYSFLVTTYLLIAVVFSIPIRAAWQSEQIDTDCDERLCTIFKHSSGNLIITGDNGTVLVSNDSGATWDDADLPDVSGFGESDDISIRTIIELPETHELIAPGVIDKRYSGTTISTVPGIGVPIPIRGSDRIEKWSVILTSHDGGKNWQIKKKMDEVALYWAFLFTGGKCILTGYADSVYELKNDHVTSVARCRHSSTQNYPLIPIPYGSISLTNDRVIKQYNELLFLIDDKKSIAVSLDNGISWGFLYGKSDSLEFNQVGIIDEKRIIAVCENGYVSVSKDAGITWRTSRISDNDLNDITIANDGTWWVVGDDGFIAYSVDFGKMWISLKCDTDKDLQKVYINPVATEGWVLGDDGELVHIFDGRNKKSLLKNEDEQDENNDISWEKRAVYDAQNMFVPIHDSTKLIQGMVLTTEPDSVDIVIDGRHFTGNNLRIPLPSGKHSLAVSKKKYISTTDSFVVKLGGIEEIDITLRPFKVTVSPTAGFLYELSNKQDWGFLLTVQAGILTFRGNALGAQFDYGALIANTFRTMAGVSIFAAHRFKATGKLYLTPNISVGGLYILEKRDSIFLDTQSLYSTPHQDTIENGIKTENLVMQFQAGLDFTIKKNERWGFSVRPAILWGRKPGLVFIGKFGAIIWIL